MKKIIPKISFFLILLCLIFSVISCSGSSNESSGGNSGQVDSSTGGSGSNDNTQGGSGTGGSGQDGTVNIINASIRAMYDEDDNLKYTFFSPATVSTGEDLNYQWNFDDGGGWNGEYKNLADHTFSQYGRTYNVQLKLTGAESSKEEVTAVAINIPVPEIYFDVRVTGLSAVLTPGITETGIKDIEYTWHIYNKEGTEYVEKVTQGFSPLSYTFASSGEYKVELYAKSPKIDESIELTSTGTVMVYETISLSDIVYESSSDALEYEYTVTANKAGLEFCWLLGDEQGEELNKCSPESSSWQVNETNISKIYKKYDKYAPYRIIKVFAREQGNTEMASSQKRVITPDFILSVTAVKNTEKPYEYTFTASFIPVTLGGNLTYSWNFSDGYFTKTQENNLTYTFKEAGWHTVTVYVESDKYPNKFYEAELSIFISNIFASVGTISSTIDISDKSGLTYIFESSAETISADLGEPVYKWTFSDGEELTGKKVTKKFAKYDESYAANLTISLQDESFSLSDVVTTMKPAISVKTDKDTMTKSNPVVISSELTLEDNNFQTALLNPVYEWYINDVKDETVSTSSITHTFAEDGRYKIYVKVNADNLKETLTSAPIYLNVYDMWVDCDLDTVLTNNREPSYTCYVINNTTNIDTTNYTYTIYSQPYIDGIQEYVSANITDTTAMKFYLQNEPGTIYVNGRDITINYQIKDSNNNVVLTSTVDKTYSYTPKFKNVEKLYTHYTKFHPYDTIRTRTFSELFYQSLFATTPEGLFSWGALYNAIYGKQFPILGTGATTGTSTYDSKYVVEATYVSGLGAEKIKDLFQTALSVVALTESGKVFTWGSNVFGGIGSGNNIDKLVPYHVEAIKEEVVAIYNSGCTLFAITVNGEVYSWGVNFHGETGTGSTEDYVLTPTKIQGLPKVKEIVGSRHFDYGWNSGGKEYFPVFAVTENGEVYVWGANYFRVMGIDDSNLPSFTYGDNYEYHYSRTPVKVGIENVKKLIVDATDVNGYDLEIITALTYDNRLYGWGKNYAGQLSTLKGEDLTNFPRYENYKNFVLYPTEITGINGTIKEIPNFKDVLVTEEGDLYLFNSYVSVSENATEESLKNFAPKVVTELSGKVDKLIFGGDGSSSRGFYIITKDKELYTLSRNTNFTYTLTKVADPENKIQGKIKSFWSTALAYIQTDDNSIYSYGTYTMDSMYTGYFMRDIDKNNASIPGLITTELNGVPLKDNVLNYMETMYNHYLTEDGRLYYIGWWNYYAGKKLDSLEVNELTLVTDE